MGKENKSYRIRTNVGKDSVVNFSVDNTVEMLEILSLKINQDKTYKLMGSDTGIVAGRVLANGGFGVPNVKISVFIPYEETDDIEQRILYTYTGTSDRNYDGVRYNLLPDKVDDDCHQNIGTFPSKRVLLDNNNWIDVFDKYYKFTTRTNDAGDYMIYGVPTGNQTVHMDVDMSDIGVLSQKPRDMIYNGYNGNMFESPTKFKVDKNIDSLVQVITQDQTVYVYPFWGDTTDSNLNASITRCDLNINYKFEPTCIFMGSVITDTGENSMTKNCVGAKKQGKMSDMITGEGKIEMIRKTPNGQVEQFSVNGDNNIDGDGVWCYQIPMNLDYVMHDEFGKMVMTDNPNIGIPTRARVRFRLSMAESPSDAIARKRARFLIPNNPRLVEEDYPDYCETKEIDYEFGTKTKNENFRDLFWNNVYTVKSYIPRLQKSRLPNNLRHLGIKTVNHSGGHNPMPFNNLRIKFNFVYMFLCALVKVLVIFVMAINTVLTFISWIIFQIGKFFFKAAKSVNISIFGGHPLNGVAKIFAEYNGHGVKDSDDISPNEYMVKVWEDMQNETNVCGGIATWFIRIFLGIGCGIELNGLCETDDGEVINVSPGTNDNVKYLLRKYGIMTCNDRVDVLYNCIENQLAQDNEVTQFNFYNDWINGVVYLPLWYRDVRKKPDGTVKLDDWCSTDNTTINTRRYKKNLRLYNTNILKRVVKAGAAKTMGSINPLANNEDTVSAVANNETGVEVLNFTKKNDENCYGYQCHKFSRTYFRVYKGLVYEKTTMLGDKVYYYKPCDYDLSTGNSDLVTLFATDLVLLGSLDSCDIHGIPQFFRTLESTTYNMPPDLMSEYYDYKDENSQNTNDEQDSEDIDLGSKITEYTGADWGNLGADQSNYNESFLEIGDTTYYVDANENQYDNGGLFYGLTCFDSYTKPKSSINLSRICELGVSLDTSIKIPTTNGNGTDSDFDTLTPDGFISYDEIYNPDYRSMFATLNTNFLKTKLNPETGLLEYDFNYLYIDNFDGSLKQLMKAKTVNGYTEKSDFEERANYINNYNLELSSDAYLNFRYGNYVKRNGNKIYYYENSNTVGRAGFATIIGPQINGKNRQPRYENSFYFYFGLNEGKTAIDKLNTEFFSDCTNKYASDVPYDLTYSGNSWCPINARDGFIAFNMNVEPPYSVKFTNKDTNDIYFQDNVNSEKFIFCDPTIPGNPPVGYEKYTLYTLDQKINDNIDNTTNEVYIIPNGTYTIELTDGYDNTYNDNITFELPKIGFVCDVNPFNCKNIELMERFKDEDELLSTTYADIANHARFVDDNMVVDMNALTYSLFDPGYIIKKDDVYYTKTPTGTFMATVASSDITVMFGDEYYYYHEPRLDRDIRGFVALSEITEDDFRIDFEPIDTDFFGANYIGTSVSVHVEYDPYPNNSTIPFGETYYLLDNGKYGPMVAQDDIIVPDDNQTTKLYAKPIVNVTERHPPESYVKYKVGFVILSGSVYYARTGSGSESDPYVYTENLATVDITVREGDEYYYKVDICGYLGYIVADGVITHYFGVPYGGQKYRIVVTQLCQCDSDLNPDTPDVWCDTQNVTIINIIVYEDEFKLFINGVDYDVIQKFKTGWTDDKLVDGDFRDGDGEYSVFNKDDIYGWDDVLNIGSYEFGGVKQLSDVNYMREGNSTLPEIMEICKVLSTSYTGNATGDDSGETPYSWLGSYCYNAPSDDISYYYKGYVNKLIYTYTITPGVTLYDANGNVVTDTQIVHGNIYYVDENHTTEAELGTDYNEIATNETVNVTRYDYKIDYIEYADNEYLYDGSAYHYENPFVSGDMKDGVVRGYPSGVRVNMFRRALRVKDNPLTHRPYELYRNDGGTYIPVTSMELMPLVTYYWFNGTTYQVAQKYPDYSNGIYTLESPIISYGLDEPQYRAEFREGDDVESGDVLVNEDNYGVLTYKIEDNVEYVDLMCMVFYDYRDTIDRINATINNRSEFARTVGGTFRINDGESILVLTTKTKAKPVKYLIVGSSEISAVEKMYNYRPTLGKQPTIVVPVSFDKMGDINNTEFLGGSSVRNVSDGYVVDRNLETASVTFTLPTLTNDHNFIPYGDDEIIRNGDVYYSDDIVAYPSYVDGEPNILPVGTECYCYTGGQRQEYYQWSNGLQHEVDLSLPQYAGKYFYKTGDYLQNTASMPSKSAKKSTVQSKTVYDFVRYAHTTETIYKIDTHGVKQYQPYHMNKYKHPYYVSVMNDNDSIIPPGKDFSNFTDLGGNKDLTSTFGVHFYNKPLTSKFSMALSFINNIPAYPKHALGDDSYFGTAYGMKNYKYYNYIYSDNSNDVSVSEGTVVYATIDNTEPEAVVMKDQYYMHEVRHNPQKADATTDDYFTKYQVGEWVNVGEIYYERFGRLSSVVYEPFTADSRFQITELMNYYHRKETLREIRENILIENGLVNLNTPNPTRYGKYRSGTTINVGDWYYTDNNGVITKNVVVGQPVTVTESDNFYYLITADVVVRRHNLVNSNDDLEYYVYNGDILYYTVKYEQYAQNSIINIGESYYEYNQQDYILKKANNVIVVNNTFTKSYYKYKPQTYYRHTVDTTNNDKDELSDYIEIAQFDIPGRAELGNVYYPYKSTSNIVINGSDFATIGAVSDSNSDSRKSEVSSKYLLVYRYCNIYDGSGYSSDMIGNYGYPISVDSLSSSDKTKKSWCVKKDDNGKLTYNNYGSQRYYDFGKYIYNLSLSKRTEDTPLEPVYKVNGDGTYTPTNTITYTLIQPGTVIGLGYTYYERAAYETAPMEYIKKTVTDIRDTFVVEQGNCDPDVYPKYYNGRDITQSQQHVDYYSDEYRGGFGCNTGTYQYSPFYGEKISAKEITDKWQPVNVFMPGFLSGYFYNGIPRSNDNKSNIKATLYEKPIDLYTPTDNNPDTYDNIKVRRLIYTPNETYNDNYPATYGQFTDFEPDSDLLYQYAELPLIDDDIIYTDGYGDSYRKNVFGTLSVTHDNPLITYFNLGRSYDYVSKNLDYEDYLVNKTFYVSDDGYVQHQSLYYVYDLDMTEYPLLYYNTGTESTYNSNLKYDAEQNRFYFSEMPELLKDINNSNYISKSKSTNFNLWAYLRKKYNQGDDVWNNETNTWDVGELPMDLVRPNDKFFVIACVNNYYTISPVIETQMFRVILNYNGFDNRKGSPVYITARDSRVRTNNETVVGGIHYIEDMYYMLYYRFVVHVAVFDYTVNEKGEAKGQYNTDVYTQVCSVPEGSAEHCYIRVDDKDGSSVSTYWASAIKVNLSSLGADAMDDSGKIYTWLQTIIEDASGGFRVCTKQTSGSDPTKGVDVIEFDSYDEMVDDYENSEI